MSKHLPEPWRANARGVVIWSKDGTVVAHLIDASADCRRIVACVNGCTGIEDPEATVPELRNALRELHDIQNGPPLIRHKARWESAMKRAIAVLKRTESE